MKRGNMTREKAVNEYVIPALKNTWNEKVCAEVINALEQETESVQFVKWVAREIFDDTWEYNKESFAEIACRKLAMLGIVRGNGYKWELVEPQESEEI